MTYSIIITGILIHLLLLYSIFDIYYISPIVKNVPGHKISVSGAPAERLVVFSAGLYIFLARNEFFPDGLRWDTFHDNPELSPYLHRVIKERKGVFGISQAHVPTESRPGHIAIFAGFTEDVSAVARGWKKNPVPFDSVFNRSDEAFIWGSPDITMLFDDHPHIHTYSYSHEEEDFNSKEAYKLDEWVFSNVEGYLNNATDSLKASRRVFFLHLLGLDTNGHGNKPHSTEYKANLQTVDAGIERTVKLFDEVFLDGRTAFLFTADHGMTDWGSHGGGSDHEILTPFVVWGSGASKGGAMKVISQVDLPPLMSALLGTEIPVNSMGILPISLLDTSPMYTFKAAFCNFLQLNEQISALRAQKAQRLWFQEYEQFGETSIKALEGQLQQLAKLGRYSPAASLFLENAESMRKAIFYYHRYDRTFLGLGVSAIFCSWILLVWTTLKLETKTIFAETLLLPNRCFKTALLLLCLFCWYCSLPWTNYFYILTPILLLSIVENLSGFSGEVKKQGHYLVQNYKTTSFSFLVFPFVGFVGTSIFLFFCVIVFIDRRFLAAISLLLLLVPHLYKKTAPIDEWLASWRGLCFLLLPFPFLPNVGRYEIPSLCVLSPLIAGFWFKYYKKIQYGQSNRLVVASFLTAFLIFLSSYVFEKPPTWIRVSCWTSLPISIILPLLTSTNISKRLFTFIGALFVPYALLSIAYESLFLLLFVPLLLIFFRFEFAHLSEEELKRLSSETISTPSSGKLNWNDYRRAALCVAFVLLALFGTGNFASMNSFNPSTLSRFISVFSPFTMAALIVSKLLIPLLMVTLVVASVLRFEAVSMKKLTYLVLILTDLMALCFFYQLKDEGSWLDIGLSISKYIVSMCISVALLLLLVISSRLMTCSLRAFSPPQPHQKCSL